MESWFLDGARSAGEVVVMMMMLRRLSAEEREIKPHRASGTFSLAPGRRPISAAPLWSLLPARSEKIRLGADITNSSNSTHLEALTPPTKIPPTTAHKMAKQQINKPKSRAAKRAATPPMELDVERPKSPTQLEKVALLGLRGDNGVQKRKTNRCKILSTKQKLRKEKLLERGESVIEKLATKREESKEKSRTVQGRRVRGVLSARARKMLICCPGRVEGYECKDAGRARKRAGACDRPHPGCFRYQAVSEIWEVMWVGNGV